MKLATVSLRPAARADVESATSWYAEQGGEPLAARFVENVDEALVHLSRHPASGSIHYGELTGHARLRFWPVKGFPYLIFYFEHDGWLDVWRVLHAERDIPASLRKD